MSKQTKSNSELLFLFLFKCVKKSGSRLFERKFVYPASINRILRAKGVLETTREKVILYNIMHKDAIHWCSQP